MPFTHLWPVKGPSWKLSVYTDISLDTLQDCFSVVTLCRPKNEGFQCW